mmetsp:Transcript_10431/g.19184  ORF Transcript_10431/g.19184 Transcript_10431/m.19184 type:complete len:1002 (-) Transcript_10431:198-3203(-)
MEEELTIAAKEAADSHPVRKSLGKGSTPSSPTSNRSSLRRGSIHSVFSPTSHHSSVSGSAHVVVIQEPETCPGEQSCEHVLPSLPLRHRQSHRGCLNLGPGSRRHSKRESGSDAQTSSEQSSIYAGKEHLQRRKSRKELPTLLGRRYATKPYESMSLASVAFTVAASSHFRSFTRRHHCEELRSKVPIFSLCQDEFAEALAETVTLQNIDKDHCILRQNEPLDALYIIVCGIMELSIDGIQLEEIGEGAVIGEQSLFSANFRSTFMAKTASKVVAKVLRRCAFSKMLARFPRERDMFVEIGDEYFRTCHDMLSYNIPLLERCDPRFLNYIDLYTARRTFWPGEVILREGTMGSTCVILHSGEVRVEVGGHHVADQRSHSIFGELALLGACANRSATVRAVKVCHVSILYRTVVMSALDQFPKESEYFAALVRNRLPEFRTSGNLQNIDFFRKCSKKLLELLSSGLEERLYMPGHAIIREGCKNESIFIILSGSCDCLVCNSPIATLKEGDLFGEMTAIGYTNRTFATVRATSICFIKVIYKARLLSALEQCPDDLTQFVRLVQERRGELEQRRWSKSQTDFSDSEFFGHCSKNFIAALLERTDVGLYMPGEDMVTEGAAGTTCFILQQGEAEVLKDGHVMAKHRAGAIFGEFTALGLCPRREMTVRAISLCIIRQLRHDVLWGVLEAFPEELTILQKFVQRKLEPSAAIALQHLPFFAGADLHFVVFIAMQATQQVALPGSWLVQEQSVGISNLFVVNRGVVQSWKAELEVCLLKAGDYFGATVVLGIHRAYPFSYSAKSMCHLISFGRDLMLEGVQRYHEARKWLETCCGHEKMEYEASLSVLRERIQVGRNQKHLWKNIGRLFPHMHCIGSGDSEEARLRICFNSWMGVCTKQRQLRLVWKAMNRAAGSRRCAPPPALTPRPLSRSTPKQSPRLPSPVAVLPSAKQNKLATALASGELQSWVSICPAGPEDAQQDDSWSQKLKALMGSCTAEALYRTKI